MIRDRRISVYLEAVVGSEESTVGSRVSIRDSHSDLVEPGPSCGVPTFGFSCVENKVESR